MVVGSTMLQVMLIVVSSVNGSSTEVSSTGIRIMSDSLMPFQPAIDEPSNILPSAKKSSSTSVAGMVTCCRSEERRVGKERLLRGQAHHIHALAMIAF